MVRNPLRNGGGDGSAFSCGRLPRRLTVSETRSAPAHRKATRRLTGLGRRLLFLDSGGGGDVVGSESGSGRRCGQGGFSSRRVRRGVSTPNPRNPKRRPKPVRRRWLSWGQTPIVSRSPTVAAAFV